MDIISNRKTAGEKIKAPSAIPIQNGQAPLDTGPQLHFYSRQIAEELNPKQHDVAAATVIQNLSFWQKNNYRQTLINGKRYCFRSLTELEKDCPYLTKSAIHKALKRLEKKLGNKFLIKRDKDKLWFSIAEELISKLKIRSRQGMSCNVNVMNSFFTDDAVKTGNIRSAVLLQNLKYQLKNFQKPKTDAEGNKYGELSPKKLCGILNFSEDTIQRSLADMCLNGHLISHKSDPSYYTLPDGFKAPEKSESKEKLEAAEVHSEAAEIHNQTAEVHSQAAEVHSGHVPIPTQRLVNQGFGDVENATCISQSCNQCENKGFKDSSLAETASQLCQPPLISKGLKVLSDLAEDKLSKMRSDQRNRIAYVAVHKDALPYDLIDPHEMPYDHDLEGQIRFQVELEDEIDLLKNCFRLKGHKVTADDESKFRKFMTDNPKICSLDLIELYEQMTNPLVLADKKWWQNRKRILKQSRTPKQFLKYMPQIIHLLNWDGDEEEGHNEVEIEPPFNDLNYAYLGYAPKSSIVLLDDGTVPTEYVAD